jgi:dienelactone hydrolase
LKGRPTVTKVDKLARVALLKGYAVIAIDARFHGKRKIKGKSLRKIWNNLHYFGDKFDYQLMIVNTVIDNRTLVDWIATQPQLDANRITLAGYSMGGQVALLMGAVDNRVKKIISVVPPFIDNKVAIASPLNLVSKIDTARVLTIYGEYDDVATPIQNQLIFENIASTDKQIVSFEEDHILPIDYVDVVDK